LGRFDSPTVAVPGRGLSSSAASPDVDAEADADVAVTVILKEEERTDSGTARSKWSRGDLMVSGASGVEYTDVGGVAER
jgi:hypothetical protein